MYADDPWETAPREDPGCLLLFLAGLVLAVVACAAGLLLGAWLLSLWRAP